VAAKKDEEISDSFPTYHVTNTLNLVSASLNKEWQKKEGTSVTDLSAEEIEALAAYDAMPLTINVRYKYAYKTGEDTWSAWQGDVIARGSTTPLERTLRLDAATGYYKGNTLVKDLLGVVRLAEAHIGKILLHFGVFRIKIKGNHVTCKWFFHGKLHGKHAFQPLSLTGFLKLRKRGCRIVVGNG
jgi:hypothetical protein